MVIKTESELTRKELILRSIEKRENSIDNKSPKHNKNAKSSILIAFTFYVVAIASKFSLVTEKGTFSSAAITQLKEEIEAFKQVFSIPSSVVEKIEQYYIEALHDNLDAIHAAKQVVTLFPDNKVVLEQLSKNLFLFIDACGGFTPERVKFLKPVVLALGFNENYFRSLLRAQIIPQQEDSFDILGVNQNVNYVDLRKAYRLLIKEWQPDRFSDNDVPQELRDAAKDKVNRIQQAFEAIKLKKGYNL